jgi:RNA polymerase sigma-70 factor, ECF subfamily
MLIERSGAGGVTPKNAEQSKSRLAGPRVISLVHARELSDQELIAMLRAGDGRGFDSAYQRYAERIFGFLVRLARSRAVAEDLFQHTFLRLAERGPSLRADSDLRAWLFSVARNAFHSHVRALAVAARTELPLPCADIGTGPERGLLLNELEAALACLATEDRELLLLVAVEGLTPQEVATMLCVDPVVLRKRLSRARARLAEALDTAQLPVRKSEVGR